MTTVASQITSLAVVYSSVYLDANQRKHQSSASLAFVWGIHRDRWIPRTKGQLRGKCFHLMTSSWMLQGTVTHLPLVPHINASVNRVSIGSDNGLSPIRHQAIISTNAGLLTIGPLGITCSDILVKMQNFSFTKMHLKISSAKWRPFSPRGDEMKSNDLYIFRCGSCSTVHVWHGGRPAILHQTSSTGTQYLH